jgi:signal transduction histidine kinase
MRAVRVNGTQVAGDAGGALLLPSRVDTLEFVFAPNPRAANAPVRLGWQLDGVESGWQEQQLVTMRMIVRFFNEAKEFLEEKSFSVHGQSPGWTGSFSDSPFVDRSEAVTIPAEASRLWVVLSSAGPPEAVGAYVVRELTISQPSITNSKIRMIPPMAPDAVDAPPGHRLPPPGWIRDGLRLSDAQVVRYGVDGEVALAIVDEGVDGHADWATLRSASVPIVAGEPIVLQWKEAYSIGRGDAATASYSNIAAGLYRFRMGGLTVMGVPTGVEASVPVTVPVGVWTTAWFWIMMLLAFLGFALAGWRFSGWRKVTRQVKAMERDRAVEQERVRIAQDIHDDLGARVTQISLLSSAAQKRDGLSEEARGDFEQVSQLSRNMVTALYETVWAVDPENDHLDSLGSYLCQMATQMCAQAGLKCRLIVPDMPQDVPLASKLRHGVIMTVKEAIHNAIRHSGASELQIRALLQNGMLTLIITDDGCGFDPTAQASGNGLSNMKRRMESCEGTCSLQTSPGSGTQVRLELSVSNA